MSIANITNNEDIEFEAQLFADYPPKLLDFASSCCILFIILGVPGNLITIIALIKSKKLRNATAVFIVNLTFSDLLFGVFNLPLAASLFGHRAWVHTSFLCLLFPILRYGLLAVSVFTVLAITINRYVMIAHQRIYGKMYTKISIAFMVLATWIGAFGALVPTLLGVWGTFGLDASIGSCTILPDADGNSPKGFLFVFAFVLPCLAICVCYARIFCIVHKAYVKTHSHQKRPSIANSNCNSSKPSPSSKDQLSFQALQHPELNIQAEIPTVHNSLLRGTFQSPKNNISQNAQEKEMKAINLGHRYSLKSSALHLYRDVSLGTPQHSLYEANDISNSQTQQKTLTHSTLTHDERSFTDTEISLSSEAVSPITDILETKVRAERRLSEKSSKNTNNSPFQGTIRRRRAASLINRPQTLSAKDRRLLKMILVIFISFVACYLPITFVKILGMDDNPVLNTLGLLLIYMTTCINPIIYVLMSSEYRQAYVSLLQCRHDADHHNRSGS
ncbi:G-protein coupled receptor moody [Macrobrachium rosenbergii]|uniref:G-protein coupled receptor moody n=1 Tax=Macrobrachium rosenbergii TaxID=79674 RepID=UPI0034D784FB